MPHPHGQTPQGYVVINTNSWTGGACIAGEEPQVYTELAAAEWECRQFQREYKNPDIFVYAILPIEDRQPSIDELWQQIQKHPDFAGGALFTTEELIESFFEPEDGWPEGEPTPEDMLKHRSLVTEELRSWFIEVIENHIFGQSWREAVWDSRRHLTPKSEDRSHG
jgi:hypothetical protein